MAVDHRTPHHELLDGTAERRALASMDGKMAEFDEDRDRNDLGVGMYAHHIVRAEELIERATAFARQPSLRIRPMHERVSVNVSFDQQRGYVATHPELGSITALSLADLRKQLDARLRGKDVKLLLDKRTRQERDGGESRASDTSAR